MGSGPPLLMFSPGGFDATLEKWRDAGRLRPHQAARSPAAAHLHHLRPARDRCSRAAASSASPGPLCGAGQGPARSPGDCAPTSWAPAWAAAPPRRSRSRIPGDARLVLYWPVGGAKYRIRDTHASPSTSTTSRQHGLDAVVSLAASDGKSFGGDPRGGPWVSVIRRDAAFAAAYAAAGCRPLPAPADGHGPHALRSRHRSRCRAGGPAAPRRPGVDRAGPRPCPRRLRRPLPARSASRARSTGTCRWRIKPKRRRQPALLEFLNRASAAPG